MIVFKTEREKYVWLAALVDGEGSIGIVKYKPTRISPIYLVRLCIFNSNISLLQRIKNVLGKCNLHQSYKIRKINHKPVHTLSIVNCQAEEIIRNILPFLVIKRKQAKLAIVMRNRMSCCKTKTLDDKELTLRDRLWITMKKLNHKGIKTLQ